MSRKKGTLAEEEAVEFLEQNGFSVVEKNFYSRFGEIDIIALKEGVMHFVEVKSGMSYENAVNNITPAKLRKVVTTAQTYMQKKGFEGDYVFDAVIVTPDSIAHIDNITL